MSLQIWLPLNGNLINYGFSNLKFSIVSENTSIVSDGKIGLQTYNNNSHNGGGLISDKTIDLGNKLSMFCWINFTQLNSGSSLTGVCGQHRYPNNAGMGITIKYASATTGYISLNTGDGTNRTYNTYTGSTLLTAGNWYHVGFTYDGNDIKLYVNGKLEKTQNYPNQKNIKDFIQVFGWSFVGEDSQTIYGNYQFIGKINDFRVYDHCLSQKEIKYLSQGLIAHYKLSETDLENTTNILTYPTYEGQYSTSWDTNLHKNAIQVAGWTEGYNGGVPEPSIGYHAPWEQIDGIPTIVMKHLNSEIGKKKPMAWSYSFR